MFTKEHLKGDKHMATKLMHEAAVFHDTVEVYETEFKKETKNLIKHGTTVYPNVIPKAKAEYKNNPNMEVRVIAGGTVETGRDLVMNLGGKTAILNFADALVPGGLVLVGAPTQEENICRCSNLYASITSKKPMKYYYEKNRKFNSYIYTDSLIYSEDVTFFKDDTDYRRVTPYKMDVITCPSPSVKIKSESIEYIVIYKRIEQIIRSAILHKVDNLVLGAWGCGAFGQNPQVVASCFDEVLRRNKAFKTVVFAIRNCQADIGNGTVQNLDIFKNRILW